MEPTQPSHVYRTMKLLPLTVGIIFSWLCVSNIQAHSDQIGALVYVEKHFQASDPIDLITIIAEWPTDGIPIITLRSKLFETELPPEAVDDLPRPDLESISPRWSTVSFDSQTMDWIEEPYLYLSINLYGPPGTTWPPTQVNFFFENDGRLTERKIKRFVPSGDGNSISTIWETWPMNSDLSATDMLAQAYHRLELPLPDPLTGKPR